MSTAAPHPDVNAPEVPEVHLTPTEELICEVLAARYRLGEDHWTFSTKTRPAAERLERRGLVHLLNGIVEKTYRARLTEAGQRMFLSPTYQPRATVTSLTYPTSYSLEHGPSLHFGVHPGGSCNEETCPFHRRTGHAMRGFPQRWRDATQSMERVCPHGYSHPDPDQRWESRTSVHLCDGCCQPTPTGEVRYVNDESEV